MGRRARADQQVPRAHKQQQDHTDQPGHHVRADRPARTDSHDEHTAEGRPDERAEMEDRGVHADGIADVAWPDHLVDEYRSRRTVEHLQRSDRKHEGVDHEQIGVAGDRDDGEHEVQGRDDQLAEDEHRALLVPVGDHAGVRAEDQRRQELEGDRQPDEGDASGDLEHEPVDRDALCPARGV